MFILINGIAKLRGQLTREEQLQHAVFTLMTALDAEASFPHSNLPLTENPYYQEFPDILKPGQIVS